MTFSLSNCGFAMVYREDRFQSKALCLIDVKDIVQSLKTNYQLHVQLFPDVLNLEDLPPEMIYTATMDFVYATLSLLEKCDKNTLRIKRLYLTDDKQQTSPQSAKGLEVKDTATSPKIDSRFQQDAENRPVHVPDVSQIGPDLAQIPIDDTDGASWKGYQITAENSRAIIPGERNLSNMGSGGITLSVQKSERRIDPGKTPNQYQGQLNTKQHQVPIFSQDRFIADKNPDVKNIETDRHSDEKALRDVQHGPSNPLNLSSPCRPICFFVNTATGTCEENDIKISSKMRAPPELVPPNSNVIDKTDLSNRDTVSITSPEYVHLSQFDQCSTAAASDKLLYDDDDNHLVHGNGKCLVSGGDDQIYTERSLQVNDKSNQSKRQIKQSIKQIISLPKSCKIVKTDRLVGHRQIGQSSLNESTEQGAASAEQGLVSAGQGLVSSEDGPVSAEQGPVSEYETTTEEEEKHLRFQCPLCSKYLKSSGSLCHHMRIHKVERSCMCEICGKCFKTRSNLRAHKITHSEEKPFKCSVCEDCFRQKKDLDSHIKRHTQERPHGCEVCGKRFQWSGNLRKHMYTHTGERPHVCQWCGLSFAQKYHMITHTRVHTGEKPYICKWCGKDFAQKRYMDNHTLEHTGEKPFVCQWCGICFTQKSGLVIHTRVHTGERPYICEWCGKGFSQRSSIVNHTRVHTGEKPYACQVCGKCFAQKITLVSHTRVHTGEKPYACQLCDKRFVYKSGLLKHHKTHNNRIDEHEMNATEDKRT